MQLDCGYCTDFVVENQVTVELTTVEKLLPIHQAQLLTCLELSGIRIGALLNFNVPALKPGIKRLRL